MKKALQIVVLLLAVASAFSATALAEGPEPWPTIPSCTLTTCK